MTTPAIEKLAARRDLFLSLARILLIATTLLWLGMMAFYDRAADNTAAPSILLTSRSAFLLWMERIDAISERRIWGGPSTLFGLQSLVVSLVVVSAVAFLRAWLNRGKLSWLGIALALAAIPLGVASVEAGSSLAYPVALTPANFARLAAMIETRQPGLIAKLKAGEHPLFPKTGGAQRHFTMSPDHHLVEAVPAGTPPLRDHDDVEGLRFALAGQAYAAGDLTTLRRLLPIDLAMPAADLPARNDFARRLVDMGNAAGVAPVPAADRAVIAARNARWHDILTWILRVRVLLQVMLWSGLSCLVIGLILRWSYSRIGAQAARLEALQAPPRRNRTASGVTPI
ncbi:MAG: hypothetical protein JWN66_2456 [Sphingomonas bacterium]|uniref:hypothetical protein n=1 Tax=Sphingomonas bacterium TaxID=1895847 RepID=UPI002623D992|nr:hypothetical protein [Sphingomonas bacterium]MDB5705340.1 hypothetical protein [Sphingomonas bacterium]